MKLVNLSVKARLFATLALTAVVMIAVGVLGLVGTKSSNGHLDAIFSNRFMPTGWIGTIESNERELLERAEDVTIRQDATAVKSALEEVKAKEADIKALWTKLEATELTSKERQIADNFQRYGSEVLAYVQDALLAGQAGTFDKAESLLIEKARPTYAKMVESGDALLRTQIEVAQEMRATAESSFKRNSALTIGAIVIGMGLAGALGFLLIRSITATSTSRTASRAAS
jgi:hypothetical protein